MTTRTSLVNDAGNLLCPSELGGDGVVRMEGNCGKEQQCGEDKASAALRSNGYSRTAATSFLPQACAARTTCADSASHRSRHRRSRSSSLPNSGRPTSPTWWGRDYSGCSRSYRSARCTRSSSPSATPNPSPADNQLPVEIVLRNVQQNCVRPSDTLARNSKSLPRRCMCGINVTTLASAPNSKKRSTW